VQRTINIIGCGRAAGSMARLWQEAGALVPGDICNRSLGSSRSAVEAIGGGRAVEAIADMRPAPLWLIGTNDHQIEAVAACMAREQAGLEQSLVFHLAGRFGLEVLKPLNASGARLAALHPVRSLTHDRLSLEDFRGTACVAEGGDGALAVLEPLISSIGGNWMPVNEVNRGLYHAALSVVSNVTKAVAWKSEKWLQSAGLEPEFAAALTNQLLHSTTQDLLRFGARQSITGPIVRGDTRTVEAHLAELQASQPADVEVYQVFIRTVLELAQERGDLDESALARFRVLLGAGDAEA
jgi:predicted short-subunit dehydrogenase-like oxidoreductase (DUF2520 family)